VKQSQINRGSKERACWSVTKKAGSVTGSIPRCQGMERRYLSASGQRRQRLEDIGRAALPVDVPRNAEDLAAAATIR